MCIDCYKSIFSGKTKAGEQIVLYQNGRGDLRIKRGDGPVLPLGPGADINYHVDRVARSVRLQIRSPQWIGEAVATRFEMVVEEGLDLPVPDTHIIRGEN